VSTVARPPTTFRARTAIRATRSLLACGFTAVTTNWFAWIEAPRGRNRIALSSS
jgi:hypothetical protein